MFRMYCGVAVLAALVQMAKVAPAEVTRVTGSWSFTMAGQGFSPPQLFSGAASFTYDDADVPENGFVVLKPLSLQMFTQTPQTIGETTFDVSNTFGSVAFDNGVLFQTLVGGFDPDRVFGGDDDFAVSSFRTVSLSLASKPFVSSGSGVSARFIHTAVPEPPALPCLALMGVAFIGINRRTSGRSGSRTRVARLTWRVGW